MDDASIFIVGANGQLGTALRQKYPHAKSADIDELDITDKTSVESFDWSKIKTIINAAAYTNVDGAETPEGAETAEKVNATAVGYLAEVAANNDIILVHISTDYVFDGTKSPHTEDEPFSPINVYGKTKANGDNAASKAPRHYILRTSWVIGAGNNFVRTMLGLGSKGVNPTVVGDQVGRLTFTTELVKAIDHLLTTKAPFGTYNLSNDGEPASWAEIAREAFKLSGMQNTVTNVTTSEYYKGKTGIAPRPLSSVLDLSKIHGVGFTSNDWHNDLAKYLKEEMK